MSAAGHSGLRTASRVGIDPENTVTPVELEVLALYASGYSYDEIAGIKFFSAYTVRNQIRRAVLRSGARNPTHLAAVAAQRQLIKLRVETGIFEPVQDLRIAGE